MPVTVSRHTHNRHTVFSPFPLSNSVISVPTDTVPGTTSGPLKLSKISAVTSSYIIVDTGYHYSTERNGMAYSVALFSETEQSRHTCPPAHQL